MATEKKRRAPAKRKKAGTIEAPAGAAEAAPAHRLGAANAVEPVDDASIRARAYGIWVEEGQPHGRDLEHWLRARDELLRTAA